MAAYEMTGKVKVVMDEVTFPSGFNKREFVVTSEDDRYPQDIKFECVKERTAMLSNLKEGQRVKVSFDLRGNEYNGRYFVNLSAWRVEAGDAVAAAPSGQPPPADDSFAPEDLDGDAPPF
jgi:hypothetical protein